MIYEVETTSGQQVEIEASSVSYDHCNYLTFRDAETNIVAQFRKWQSWRNIGRLVVKEVA